MNAFNVSPNTAGIVITTIALIAKWVKVGTVLFFPTPQGCHDILHSGRHWKCWPNCTGMASQCHGVTLGRICAWDKAFKKDVARCIGQRGAKKKLQTLEHAVMLAWNAQRDCHGLCLVAGSYHDMTSLT